MKKAKLIFYCTLFFAGLFGAVSLVFYFGEWKRFQLLVLAGGFVGLIAAPEFEPKAFRRAWVYQLLSGSIAGGLLGMSFVKSFEAAAIGAIVGGVLGVLAPYWVKEMPVP